MMCNMLLEVGAKEIYTSHVITGIIVWIYWRTPSVIANEGLKFIYKLIIISLKCKWYIIHISNLPLESVILHVILYSNFILKKLLTLNGFQLSKNNVVRVF